MIEQLRANVGVLLKFYARNRLLLVVALLLLVLAALTVSASLVYGSTSAHFDIIAEAVSTLNGYALVLSAALGLFAISSHLRQRSVKMVLTKPCLPEVWIASVFLSGLAVAALLYALNVVFGVGLSLLWGVPVQTGLYFLAAEGLLKAAIALGYLSFLTTVFHPVLAILVALVFNESTFYGLRMMLLTAIKTTGGNPVLPLLEWATYGLYMVLPAYDPYGKETATVADSLRASGADWLLLARTAGYSATALALFFLLTVWALRRRNLA
jgi:hypothetical protein